MSGGLGLLLLTGAYAAQTHAARGALLPPDGAFEVTGAGPVHVVGVLGASTVEEPTTCLTRLRSGTSETVEVGVRHSRSRSIPEGVRLPAGTVSVTCDKRFSVSTGPVVLAYPLAGSSALFAAYLAITVAGFAIAGREMRARRAVGRAQTAALASRLTATPESQDTRGIPSWRRSLLTIAFLLAVMGPLAMLALSMVMAGHRHAELLLNLVLLLVVIPAAFGATLLSRSARHSRRP